MIKFCLPHAILLAGLAGYACVGASQDPLPPPPRIVLLHTNDLHGQVHPMKDRGGISALASKLKKLKAEESAKGAKVFIVDCGDFFQGTPEGDLAEGRLVIDVFNEIGYDALCVGNHDFDFGPEVLEALSKRARFPFLAANVRNRMEETPPYLKSKIAFPDAQVEFLGLLSSDMPVLTQEKARVGLTFLFERDVLKRLLPDCRTRVIVLSHLGHERELELAKENPVAAWIGGHSHRKMQERTGTTLYAQAGARGEWIGVVEIGETTTGRFEAVSPKDGEDPTVKEIVARYTPEIDKVMNEVVGELAVDCSRQGEGSSLLGNWLCDLMREATGAEIAFHNRTGIRADLAKGPLRLRDLYQVSPFRNTLVTMKLKGREIVELLTHALSHPKVLLEVSGIELNRSLTEIQVGKRPLDRDRDYLVVTNSFLAKGGDAHSTFTRGREGKDTLLDLLEIHKAAVRKSSPVRLSFAQRIHPE